MSKDPGPVFEKITIAKARELSQIKGMWIWWRPNKDLLEHEQFAVVKHQDASRELGAYTASG